MRLFYRLVLLTTLVFSTMVVCGQTTDSVDIIDYDLTFDLSAGKPFAGKAVLTMQLTRDISHFSLQLKGTVDSIVVAGEAVAEPMLWMIPVGDIEAGVPFTVTVFYHGSGYVESYGFGGMHFDNDMTYNLGAAFKENPHGFGRCLYPCRDNFTDKATYTLRITSKAGWTAECSGTRQSSEVDSEGREHSVWRIDQPVATYIVGVSQSNYHRIESSVAGYPLTLGYTTQDSSRVAQAFALLDTVVPMFERCFGPYRWGRIGYIPTKTGSMEHVNNIALAKAAMDAPSNTLGQHTIAHELGHAWFGNLVTCRSAGDMWFNEGGASFASEVACEAAEGKQYANSYYMTNLEEVVRTTHHTDNGLFALTGMPTDITYGSTTYDKGWLVWHSLRGYLGEDLFYASLRRLFADKAFGTVNMAEVCDSLSRYSGVDLTDFFRFHVATPGFIDYHVDLRGLRLTISQQGVYTDSLARSSRVPITFLSADGQQEKRWYTFSGSDTSLTVLGLPFEPVYALLDRDYEISDAVTRAEPRLTTNALRTLNMVHLRLKPEDLQNPVQLYIDHHWGHAYGIDTTAGVLRSAGRYWTVQGDVDWQSGIEARFRYTRGGYASADYPYLDEGFYDRVASLDSIALMHRYNCGEPWRCVSRSRMGTDNEGFFTCNLERGEYTLAVIDTALLGIPSIPSPSQSVQFFPNPLRRGEALNIDLPEGTYSISIYNADGRRMWHRDGVPGGKKLRPNLKKGTYLVVIKNNSVSLQSKLIQL